MQISPEPPALSIYWIKGRPDEQNPGRRGCLQGLAVGMIRVVVFSMREHGVETGSVLVQFSTLCHILVCHVRERLTLQVSLLKQMAVENTASRLPLVPRPPPPSPLSSRRSIQAVGMRPWRENASSFSGSQKWGNYAEPVSLQSAADVSHCSTSNFTTGIIFLKHRMHVIYCTVMGEIERSHTPSHTGLKGNNRIYAYTVLPPRPCTPLSRSQLQTMDADVFIR